MSARRLEAATPDAADQRDNSCTSVARIHDSDVTQPPPPTWPARL